MEIIGMTSEHEKWGEIAEYAEKCSWKAGTVLAEKMRNNGFRDWERVFAAYSDGKPVAFCTFTERDCLSPRYLYSPFIGFIFVDESARGKGVSCKLIEEVKTYARINGYGRIYVMSGEKGLYEKYGFQLIGMYETTYGTKEQLFFIQS